MCDLQLPAKRIIGVRVQDAGDILFCEASPLTPVPGEWVIVQGEGVTFAGRVVLPDSLVEASRFSRSLPVVLRAAGEADLVAAGFAPVLEARAARQFNELIAAHNLPYQLKEVRFSPDTGAGLLALRFSAPQEPTSPEYVLLLKGLAESFATRLELFLVSGEAKVLNPPSGEKFIGWVNNLLAELDPPVMAQAVVGERLLDEAAVYRPGQRATATARPAELATAAAWYDPATTTFSVGGAATAPPGSNVN